MGTNFGNGSMVKKLDLNVRICFTDKKIVPGQKRISSGLSENTSKIKIFFGYAS